VNTVKTDKSWRGTGVLELRRAGGVRGPGGKGSHGYGQRGRRSAVSQRQKRRGKRGEGVRAERKKGGVTGA
jgi:hypothetical protein